MKSTLTLKQSSFLFTGTLNLVKGTPLEVDTDSLAIKELNILNRYIKSGGVHSENGLLPLPEETVTVAVAELPVEEVVIETVEEKKEEVVKTEEVAPKKTTPAKTTKKK